MGGVASIEGLRNHMVRCGMRAHINTAQTVQRRLAPQLFVSSRNELDNARTCHFAQVSATGSCDDRAAATSRRRFVPYRVGIDASKWKHGVFAMGQVGEVAIKSFQNRNDAKKLIRIIWKPKKRAWTSSPRNCVSLTFQKTISAIRLSPRAVFRPTFLREVARREISIYFQSLASL